MRNNPIAVVDSGIGGLSLLKPLVEKYPNENYVYLADNEYMPYGNKSKSFIKTRLFQIVEYLQQNFNVKMVILACNTASAIALDYLKSKFQIEILGLNLNKYSVNGYTFCTRLASMSYSSLNCIPCPRLAQNIEDNYFDKRTLSKKIEKIVKKSLLINSKNELDTCSNPTQNIKFSNSGNDYNQKLEENEINSEKHLNSEPLRQGKENLGKNIILGCTHYELVAPLFKKVCDANIILPCKDFVDELQLKHPNLQNSGNVVMLSTIPTKSYIDKLWKVFKCL